MMRKLTYIILACTALAVAPAQAYAFPWFSGEYTIGGSNCAENLKDPVNAVFKGNRGAAAAARNTVVHTGWSNTSGGTQSLWVVKDAGPVWTCQAMKYQRASGSWSRFHVRYWRVPESSGDSKLSPATPHHEDFVVSCPGHAVDSNGPTGSGFDWGRRELVDKFQNGGHTAEGKWWGNTQNFKQCDDDWAGSDGVGVVIGNNHRH